MTHRLRGWLHRKRSPGAEPPAPAAPPSEPFDAVIKIGPNILPPNVSVHAASSAVRAAIQAIPGAEMVSVQHYPAGTGPNPVAVFPASGSIATRGPLQAHVARLVTAAIRTLGETFLADLPVGLATGFAEGQDFRFGTDLLDAPRVPADLAPPVAADLSGPDLRNLGDAALLAQLLDYVVPAQSGDTAERAIKRFGSFGGVLSAPEIDLRTVAGLGTHSIAAIKLINAAALRLALGAIMDQPVLSDIDRLIHYLTAVLARESIEHFRILFLDAEGRLRADEAQARGTVNHTPVYPREVVRRALELRAACVILVHNHPSGDPSPSSDDFEMTARIEEAGSAVGVKVHDHIIVGNGRWFSFRREGMLTVH